MAPSQLVHTLRAYFSMNEGRAKNEVIRGRIESGARMDGIHMCLLIVAMTIASIGLNVDSTEAIVGAMLICPLMGSVLAIAYGVAALDYKLMRSSLVGLVIQMSVCLATSTLYFVISPISNATSELLTNASPTLWDLLIAFAGGFAGAIGTSRRQEPSTLIAGVAVATALMPPLCATGYGIAMRNLESFALALYEFLINVVFIAFGAEIIFVWLRVPLIADLDGNGVVTDEERATARKLSDRLRRNLTIGTIAFTLPCVFFSAHVVHQTRMENGGELFEAQDTYDVEVTTWELKAVFPEFSSYSVGTEESYDQKSESVVERVVATIHTTKDVDADAQRRMEDLVRIHVPQLDRVAFVTDAHDGKAATTAVDGTSGKDAQAGKRDQGD